MKLKILLLLMISQYGFSQMWADTYDEAKKLAKETNKFVLVDFTATWCKPCRKMEQDFWYNTQYKTTLDKFVIVSIDIDRNRDIAQKYNIQSIPNVKLLDVNGDVIYETLGFRNAAFFNNEFEGFPNNSDSL